MLTTHIFFFFFFLMIRRPPRSTLFPTRRSSDLERYRPLGDPTRHLQALITLISRCKDEDIAPDEYRAAAERLREAAAAAPDDAELADLAVQQVELAATYAKYQDVMAREGAIDFG